MTPASPLDDFDYRRIDLAQRTPLSAHCFHDLALIRAESYFNLESDPEALYGLNVVKEQLKITELWAGLHSSPKGYRPIPCTPTWFTIDKGAIGLKAIHQFFPRLSEMDHEEWKIPKNRQRLTGIMCHTDAIPLLASLEVLAEHATGHDRHGKPIRHEYKGS